MCNILTIHLSWSRPSVHEPWIVIKCSVDHGSWSLKLAAWSLKLYAWSLRLAAWSFLRLEACLRLEAFFSQFSFPYSTLDGEKYGSYLIYSLINFLCLMLPYLCSGSALIFFKISFCLVFAVYNTFSSTVPTLPAAPALVALSGCRAGHRAVLRGYA